jgi:hypothetical protein
VNARGHRDRRLVINTRQPPVDGFHWSSNSGDSQLSKISSRGIGLAQAATTARTLSSRDKPAKSGRRSKNPTPPQAAISLGTAPLSAKLSQKTPPAKYWPLQCTNSLASCVFPMPPNPVTAAAFPLVSAAPNARSSASLPTKRGLCLIAMREPAGNGATSGTRSEGIPASSCSASASTTASTGRGGTSE